MTVFTNIRTITMRSPITMIIKTITSPALLGLTLLALLFISATPTLARSYMYSESLDRDSKFLLDRYETPANRPPPELIKISRILTLSGQRDDAKSLRQFTDRVVLYKLLGEPQDASGTVGSAILAEARQPESLYLLFKRVLDKFEGKLLDSKTSLPSDTAPSDKASLLWFEKHGRDEFMHTRIRVHNRGPITVGDEFKAYIMLSVPGASINFNCQQESPAQRLAPGDGITMVCRSPSSSASLLFSLVGGRRDIGLLSSKFSEGVKTGAAGFKFFADEVSFPEHRVKLVRLAANDARDASGITFFDEAAITAAASAEMNNSSCFARGSCVRDIQNMVLHPAEYDVFGVPLSLVLVGLVVCLLLYLVYRFLPRLAQSDTGSNRWVENWGRAGTGTSIGAVVGVILAAVFPGEASWIAIPVFALAGFAISSGPFLVLLLLILAPVQIAIALWLFQSGSKSGYDGFVPVVIFVLSSGFVGLPVLGATIKLGNRVLNDRETATWLNWTTLILGAAAILVSIIGFLYLFTIE